MSCTQSRLRPFGTTIFAEMSALARQHGAINLSQGFPDEDGPPELLEYAAKAIREQDNQYAPLPGLPELREAIRTRWVDSGNRALNPESEITVTNGCTGAIAATLLGLLEPGDEVILFEPFYDSYRACVALAGATARFVQLREIEQPGGGVQYGTSISEVQKQITPRTRAILLNTPHNPSGTVLHAEFLNAIAKVCVEQDLIAISDEVYEHLVFSDAPPHTSIASIPGMEDRTVTLSSLGKTFSVTGWKIGWAIAAPPLTAAVRSAHQFLSYAVSTPLQRAAAFALRSDECVSWLTEHRAKLQANRDFLCSAIAELGFDPMLPDAGYFVLARHDRISQPRGLADDVDVARELTSNAGVAVIPPSAFCADTDLCRDAVRFAFCKKRAVLEDAVSRLRDWIADDRG